MVFIADPISIILGRSACHWLQLMHWAITKLLGLANRNRVPLRRSYPRLAERAAIMVGCHTARVQKRRLRRHCRDLHLIPRLRTAVDCTTSNVDSLARI